MEETLSSGTLNVTPFLNAHENTARNGKTSDKDREFLKVLSSNWLLRKYSVPWPKVRVSVNIYKDFVRGICTWPNTEL